MCCVQNSELGAEEAFKILSAAFEMIGEPVSVYGMTTCLENQGILQTSGKCQDLSKHRGIVKEKVLPGKITKNSSQLCRRAFSVIHLPVVLCASYFFAVYCQLLIFQFVPGLGYPS